MKNILDAIITLVKRNNLTLYNSQVGNNRANDMGAALEIYVKNLFADAFDCSEMNRLEKWSETFSYIGNNANPPDFMLRDGDAVEVKKIESNDSALALNSSYPKRTLKSSSTLISNACRDAEEWSEKDMIYVVGVVTKGKLKHLCMIYGQDYCASDECYNRIQECISRVDPLGITYLRIRGMWHIENPWRVFDYVYSRNFNAEFNFMCIVNRNKWLTFNNRDEFVKLQKDYPALKIVDVKIKNPDNPTELQAAKLISYVKE